MREHSPNARLIYRRGQFLALIIGVLALAVCLGFLLAFAQYVTDPDISTFVTLLIMPATIFAALGIARLNHHAHISLAALLTALLVDGLFLAQLLFADGLLHGLSWTDVPTWDLLLIGLVIIALTLRPWQVWIALTLYCGFLIALVVYLPQQLELQATNVTAPLTQTTTSLPQAPLPLDTAILAPSIILAIVFTILSLCANSVLTNALLERDDLEDIARQRALLTQQHLARIERDHRLILFIRDVFAIHSTALKKGHPFTPPPIPADMADDPVLQTIRGFWQTISHWMDNGQRNTTGINRWVRYLLQLSASLHQQRQDGVRATDELAMDEILQLVAVPGGVGTTEIATLQTEFRKSLTEIVQRDEEVYDQFKLAITEARENHTVPRFSQKVIRSRLGHVALAISDAFNLLAETSSTSSTSPQPQRSTDTPTSTGG